MRVMRAIESAPGWLRWGLVAAYFVAASLGHLVFTQWLLRPRENAWLGSYAFKDAVPALLVVGGLALLAWVLRGVRRSPRDAKAVAGYWMVWALCVFVVDRKLTYSVYEYAHYPQYALMAWLLAWALDAGVRGHTPGRTLFWATLLGMVDECMQYLWITPSYGNYLDFNDFVVNLLGAAGGMMLYEGRPGAGVGAVSGRVLRVARTEWAAALLLGGLVSGALLGGRVQVSPAPGLAVPAGGWMAGAGGAERLYLQRGQGWYGHWQEGPHRGRYYVLPPVAGLLFLGAAGGVFTVSAASRRH